jgi:hypothetical protein
MRKGATGIEFDPTAGVLGSILRAITTPYDILAGNIPTPYSPGASAAPSADVLGRAAETASILSPISPSYRAGARFGTVTPLGEPTINPFASGDQALFGGLRGNLTKAPLTPPSAQEIKDAGGGQYNAIRGSGLDTPSSQMGDLASTIRAILAPILARRMPSKPLPVLI